LAVHHGISVEALLVPLHDLVRREELEGLFGEGLAAGTEILRVRAGIL
jgi:hypothetical protein